MVLIESDNFEKIPESDSGDRLYKALLSQYSLVRDRNDSFMTKAQNLLGFAGIIVPILVALIIAMVSDETIKTLLQESPNFKYICTTVIIGFLGYIISLILGLAAFRTTKYMPIPQIKSVEFIDEVFENKTNLSIKHLALQAFEAIAYYDERNAEKYTFLFWATVSLIIAIISTAILGIFLLSVII